MGAYDSIHAFPLQSSLWTRSMQEEIKASRLQTSGSSGLKKLGGIRAGALDMSLWILKWALLPTAILWRAMLMEGWYIPGDNGSCARIFLQYVSGLEEGERKLSSLWNLSDRISSWEQTLMVSNSPSIAFLRRRTTKVLLFLVTLHVHLQGFSTQHKSNCPSLIEIKMLPGLKNSLPCPSSNGDIIFLLFSTPSDVVMLSRLITCKSWHNGAVWRYHVKGPCNNCSGLHRHLEHHLYDNGSFPSFPP